MLNKPTYMNTWMKHFVQRANLYSRPSHRPSFRALTCAWRKNDDAYDDGADDDDDDDNEDDADVLMMMMVMMTMMKKKMKM
eukprot:12427387-Karenia_brevis.AAC.1